MHENLKTQGLAVPEEQLIDLYRSTQDQPSPWMVISDQVMGGDQRSGDGWCITCSTTARPASQLELQLFNRAHQPG